MSRFIIPTDNQILDDWYSEKNAGLSPFEFTSGSTYSVYWKCHICGYEWQTSINHKFRGDRCPVCSGRKVISGINDLASQNPELAKEWDHSSNELLPDQVYFRSSKKFNWICLHGHSYPATITHRIAGTGCPYCANKKVLVGFNDLASRFPQIVAEWDYDKNVLTPEQVVYGSNKSAHWKCKDCGNEWSDPIRNRTLSGTGCEKCSDKRGGRKNAANAAKRNNLATNYPDLVKEWDYELNAPINPEDVSGGTNQSFGWICSKCGWKWSASPNTRTSGVGCPACANRVVHTGFNDLQTLFPEIAKEWDYEKNSTTPDKVIAGSNKAYYWKCSVCGYRYKKSANARTQERGCKICGIHKSANSRVRNRAIKNNFAAKYPDIAAEWDYVKNEGRLPQEYSCGSNEEVFWKCSFCGHEWKAKINSRTSRKNTCPNCSYVGTSFPEQAVYYYLNQVFPDAENRCKVNGTEFDVFIPSIQMAVEYDGVFYHKNKIESDNAKDVFCEENKICLYRFRDSSLPDTRSANRITVQDGSIKSLKNAIAELIKCLTHQDTCPVNIEEDQIKIRSKFKHEIGTHSVGTLFPALAVEWNQAENGALTPYNTKPASNTKVSWKCSKCGCVWKAAVCDRTRNDHPTGCPVCANKKVVSGINDLQTKYPDIAGEWHPTKNGDLLPSMVAPGSNKSVWWQCPICNSDYTSAPNTRTGQGCGCPVCTGKKIKIGVNDLATTCPDLAKEWNYEKNGNSTPQSVTKGSQKKVWWKCAKGHEWQASINNRVKGNGCYQCFLDRKRERSVVPGQIVFEEE